MAGSDLTYAILALSSARHAGQLLRQRIHQVLFVAFFFLEKKASITTIKRLFPAPLRTAYLHLMNSLFNLFTSAWIPSDLSSIASLNNRHPLLTSTTQKSKPLPLDSMKIKKSLQLFVCIVATTFPCALAEESPEEAVKRMAQMGGGVHDVKKDEKGALQSLKVVGQERISKVLGPAKGMMLAQKRASLKANAEFVEWMEKNVTSVTTTDDQTILTLSGDGESVSEQGKSDEKTTEQITQVAQGLVKGLKLVGKDQDPETGLLTLVYSWSLSGVQLANEAKQANNRPPESPAKQNQEKSGQPSEEIQKKTIVSPDFDE